MRTDKKLGLLFEKLAQPNAKGFSNKIDVRTLMGEYEILNITNGSSYTREGSYLDKKYFLKKYYEKYYEKYILNTKEEPHKNGIGKGKLQYIELIGFKNEQSI